MVRPIGFLAGAGFVVALLWALLLNVVAYVQDPPKPSVEHEFHLKPKSNVSWSFEGVGGKYDQAQLQRGFKVYKEVCSACHSLKQVAFRDLEEIGFNKAQVKTIAKEWVVEVPSVNPETGEPSTRKAVPADKFPSPYANDVAARAANNNALPPDQSLLAKAREGGPHYIYSLLTGYTDQAGYKNAEGKELLKEFPDAKTPDGLHFNPYFANLNLAMAPPLTDGQVTFDDGSKNDVKAEAKDVTAFLMWAAEPNLPTRHAVGWAALAYLLIFTTLTYLAYRSIWADKKPKKKK